MAQNPAKYALERQPKEITSVIIKQINWGSLALFIPLIMMKDLYRLEKLNNAIKYFDFTLNKAMTCICTWANPKVIVFYLSTFTFIIFTWLNAAVFITLVPNDYSNLTTTHCSQTMFMPLFCNWLWAHSRAATIWGVAL